MICATASRRHDLDHIAPVWRALPPAHRGAFFVPAGLLGDATALGVEGTVYRGDRPPWTAGGPILVAATQDERRARPARRPVVMMAHGCGQAFDRADGSPHPGYAGGRGRENVALFLSPNEYQARRWRSAYPDARVEVIGCPKLDQWPRETGRRDGPVCISFHWDCRIAPEAGTAWQHYRPILPELAARLDLVGHAHPRIARALRPVYARLGIPFLETFDEVLERCSIYVNDCSSTLYEFAACGGPVVVLNAPRFRRRVHHGLRFWEFADVGVQVDGPAELADAIALASVDPPAVAARRREVVRHVFPHHDAAARAAAAILQLEKATA